MRDPLPAPLLPPADTPGPRSAGPGRSRHPAFGRRLDVLGLVLAFVCAAHCLLTPLLLFVFPLLAGGLLAQTGFHLMFHQTLLWVVVPAGALALILGWPRHRDLATVWLIGGGILALVFAAFWLHDIAGPGPERALTVVGGLATALGHLYNLILCQRRAAPA